MANVGSVFLRIPESEWIAQNSSVFAVFDAHPASPGHALIIPRRLVASWFAATKGEVDGALDLLHVVKDLIDERFSPAGYNVGFNDGLAGGQTVFHAHLHLIPRYSGDVADPAGGIRHAVLGHGYY